MRSSPGPRRLLRLAAALATAAALGAGAALGVVLAVDSPSSGPATKAPVIAAQPAALAAAQLDPSEIYERAAPGVVEIEVTGQGEQPFPFGPSQTESQGSGFVLDTKGNIVTSAHVVEEAASITVRLQDGAEAKATLVGSDPSTDLAVIKVDVSAGKLKPLELGSSSGVKPGQGVVAIGSPFGLEDSITAGIVSAVGRTIRAPDGTPIAGAVQTDAALNSGNSGGPLLDAAGRVIGVNAQIESTFGGSSGVGFAVPIDTVRTVASQLIESGKVEHAFLGVRVQTVTAAAAQALGLPRGVQVGEVQSGTPAAKAGLKAGTQTQTVGGRQFTKDGDVIVSLDGKPVASAESFSAAITAHKPGDKVELGVVRNGERRTVTVTLTSRPS